MKQLLGLLTTFIVAVAFSGPLTYEPHWVEVENNLRVYDTVTHATDLKADIYFDDANLISEDGYVGYTFKWIFDVDVQTYVKELNDDLVTVDPNAKPVIVNYRTLFTTIEINCSNDASRAKRISLISTPHNVTYQLNDNWSVPDERAAGGVILDDIAEQLCPTTAHHKK